MNDSFGKHCPLPTWEEERKRAGGPNKDGVFKTNKQKKTTSLQVEQGDRLIRGRTQSSKIKANSKTFSDTRTPIKQIKQTKSKMKNKWQTIQSNHTK